MNRSWYSVDRSGVDDLITDIITQQTEPLEDRIQELLEEIIELQEELEKLKNKYE